MTTSENVGYNPTPVGELRPQTSPLGRRDTIRDSLEAGSWQRAAVLLHEAHTHQEWHGCGLSSWREYVETIPMSRMHDWRLRLLARSSLDLTCYTLRGALREIAQSPRLADTAEHRAPV